MPDNKIELLKNVKDFESLIKYLRDELLWPIEREDAEDITFDYNPKDLGIEEQYAAKIRAIKQIRPFTDKQPWGIFFIEFEPKKLPVIVMRRILRALIHTRRSYDDRNPTWDLHELMLISSLGEEEERKISFAHFTESEKGLPELRTFSWDASDTYFHYLQNKLDLEKLHWPKNDQDIDSWRDQWSSAFTRRYREVIRTSQQLAVEMARLAAQIREQIKNIYQYEISDGPLHKLFSNFKSVLIHDLDINSFADMYAQTIAYGLFSARATHEGEFIVEDIPAMIPNTNPFLKELFEECTNIGKSCKEDNLDLDEIGVTELIKTLKESNIEAVLSDFGRQKRGEDPVVHFYEHFLREYDAEQKVKRGVFYTPDPVVSFIVRSVDYLLQAEFNCPDGLADNSKIKVKRLRPKKKGNGYVEDDKLVAKVQILDPAVGTGTFLKHVIDVIKKRFDEKYSDLNENELKKIWNKYVAKDLLSRLFGFELMMAPYAVCHLKLGLELRETGYEFISDKRLGVYLTNTLEGTHKGAGTIDAYANFIANEGHKANVIKVRNKISVIVGNPPYSVSSLNRSKWIMDLLEDYKKNVKSEETQIQGLSDDYIKFIRFAHWKLNKSDSGIMGYITNHGFLDGLLFRDMRENLLNDFSEIYILNLHGSSRRKSIKSDQIDQNVFDIQQGVSIVFLIKKIKPTDGCIVKYSEIMGDRIKKYQFLLKNCINTLEWKLLNPIPPHFLFIPVEEGISSEYQNNPSIIDIFGTGNEKNDRHKKYGAGFVSQQDEFAIAFTPDELIKNVTKLLMPNMTEEELRQEFRLCKTNQWSFSRARSELSKLDWKLMIIKCLYRPFDFRYTILNRNVVSIPRDRIMSNLTKPNIALFIGRQGQAVDVSNWNLVFCGDTIEDYNLFRRGNNICFPLYIYDKFGNKSNNLNQILINKLLKQKNIKIYEILSPEKICYYIYSILNSIGYRTKYLDLLNRDFPRIPFTSNKTLFLKLCELGENLTNIHLMKFKKVNDFDIILKGEGNNKIESIGIRSYRNGKLFINKNQYFEEISEEVYNFVIGGYQVCQKWLKDRKGRVISDKDIEHFQKIIFAIDETIKIMKKIDNAIEENGGWPIK